MAFGWVDAKRWKAYTHVRVVKNEFKLQLKMTKQILKNLRSLQRVHFAEVYVHLHVHMRVCTVLETEDWISTLMTSILFCDYTAYWLSLTYKLPPFHEQAPSIKASASSASCLASVSSKS